MFPNNKHLIYKTKLVFPYLMYYMAITVNCQNIPQCKWCKFNPSMWSMYTDTHTHFTHLRKWCMKKVGAKKLKYVCKYSQGSQKNLKTFKGMAAFSISYWSKTWFKLVLTLILILILTIFKVKTRKSEKNKQFL